MNKYSLYTLNSFYNQNIVTQLYQQNQQHDVYKNINKKNTKLVPDTTVTIPKAVESEIKYKPQKIEFNTQTELINVDDTNYTVNILNHRKRLNSNKELINDEEDELLYTIKFDKETNELIISLLHSTGTSDTTLILTLKYLIVPNKENNKPKIIIRSHSKEEKFKIIIDNGKLDIIDVLFGNDILEDSIIDQKDKIIKLNNSSNKIKKQQSDQLHCNVKSPRKHVTFSNDNNSESNNLLDDDQDIKEQVYKFVESIHSKICDILSKTNP
ncbi:hypothetical protein ACTFIW_013336 [Dictyostelium discoideum]